MRHSGSIITAAVGSLRIQQHVAHHSIPASLRELAPGRTAMLLMMAQALLHARLMSMPSSFAPMPKGNRTFSRPNVFSCCFCLFLFWGKMKGLKKKNLLKTLLHQWINQFQLSSIFFLLSMFCDGRMKRSSDPLPGPSFQKRNNGEIEGMVSSSNIILPFSLSILLLLLNLLL